MKTRIFFPTECGKIATCIVWNYIDLKKIFNFTTESWRRKKVYLWTASERLFKRMQNGIFIWHVAYTRSLFFIRYQEWIKITLPVALEAEIRTGSAFHPLKVNLFQIEYVILKNLNCKIGNTLKFLTINLAIWRVSGISSFFTFSYSLWFFASWQL